MEENTVDLWAADEIHFQQHGSRCRMSVPPETKDPVGPGAATSPDTAQRGILWYRAIAGWKVSVLSGDWQIQRADLLRIHENAPACASLRRGRRVVVITDNAKYHHARLHKEWRENHVEDFVLDYLPPYSPELNPMERA